MTDTPQFDELARNLDLQTYERFKTAVELGRWPNGDGVKPEQRELMLQAIILYEQQHLPEDQRTAFLPKKDCGTDGDEADTLQWRDS